MGCQEGLVADGDRGLRVRQDVAGPPSDLTQRAMTAHQPIGLEVGDKRESSLLTGYQDLSRGEEAVEQHDHPHVARHGEGVDHVDGDLVLGSVGLAKHLRPVFVQLQFQSEGDHQVPHPDDRHHSDLPLHEDARRSLGDLRPAHLEAGPLHQGRVDDELDLSDGRVPLKGSHQENLGGGPKDILGVQLLAVEEFAQVGSGVLSLPVKLGQGRQNGPSMPQHYAEKNQAEVSELRSGQFLPQGPQDLCKGEGNPGKIHGGCLLPSLSPHKPNDSTGWPSLSSSQGYSFTENARHES